MDPYREIPLVFAVLGEVVAGGRNLRFADRHRLHRDARVWVPAQEPNPLVDPSGFAAEQERLRTAYAEAYSRYFAENLPENGVPCRFTVHLVDVPDKAASYEFYSVGLLQRALQRSR